MNSVIQYKDYIGSVEFSEEDLIFYGKVQGISSLISYEGKNGIELIYDFHNAIDEYLSLCEKEGIEPEKAYKGSLNIRIGSELHRQAAIYSITHNKSLNSFIEEAVKEKLEKIAS